MDINQVTENISIATTDYDYDLPESFSTYNYWDLIPTSIVYGMHSLYYLIILTLY